MTPSIFPFGQPLLPCEPSGNGKTRLFILGAYPSALHVRWTPPKPLRPIQAIAVDNEPEPFWTGLDEDARIEAWKAAVGWQPEWGIVAKAGKLNGSSGRWVENNVLTPLSVARAEAWITDCLNTYRCSESLAARLEDTYTPFARDFNRARHVLIEHPSEDDIVREALSAHRERLSRQLADSRPDLVVTLGNAALRVLAEFVEIVGHPAQKKLAVEGYGSSMPIKVGSRNAEWLPLAHPAAPEKYQLAHEEWIKKRMGQAPLVPGANSLP